MTHLEEVLLWVAALAGVVGTALCSGMEIACYSINRVRLALRAGRIPPDRAARLIRAEIDQPDRLLTTLLVGMNIATYGGALAMTELLEVKIHSPALVALINTCVLTPVLLIFGEALPKELFRTEADRLAYFFASPLAGARVGLSAVGLLPLIRIMTRTVEKMSGLPQERISDARQRIAILLKEGAEHGVLSESQVTLVDRALMLRGVTVADEMVPWSIVRTVPLDADRTRAMKIIGPSRHARVPVVGAIESSGPGARPASWGVVGVLEQIDLYVRPEASIAELVRPVVRFKRTTRVREALLLLREHKCAMGIVEDDHPASVPHGRPLGIVTAKDLVEPLTGELADV